MTHANRGMALERAIEATNLMYRSRGVAMIQSISVPTKALPDRTTDTIKVIRHQSTVDFIGAWDGRPIAFDAKQNENRARFPLSNVHAHQVDFLRSWRNAGGVSFLLIYHVSESLICLLPYERLAAYWDRWQAGGEASIPVADLRQLPKVRPGRGCPTDYLATVKAWLETEGKQACGPTF
jgi:recombination protein U